ncbi:signal recognition particle-docking protein FtsY [Halospeciosus flavus]|uniref:Signal recognition particle receptor FtsY n=1 Tax=Halospeciosus flavus TaxID=3032283 RepID=A0ABD5Z7P7_9EURY|nr:signal recognition particle-docking protein FtsY [Halospeciosus flavus]
MFDGLKDKLNNFRKDAEEVAEEKAEEVEEPEAEAEAETAEAETETAAEAEAPETEAEAETETEAAEAEEPESEAVEEPEAAATEEAAEGAEEETETESSSGTSFTRKAKSFARGRVVIEEEDLEDQLWDLEMALLESDVEMSVAEEILDRIREELVGEEKKFTESTGDLVESALRDALLEVIGVGQFDFVERIEQTEKPVVVIFTGINGVGKTTSIAKLSKYLEDRGLSTVLANGDTYRAGANEQIREHAETLGTEIITHEQGGDPAAVIYDGLEYAQANDIDVVLGDTAGRLHTSEDLMAQLEKIDRVVDPDMTIFVDEAVAGQDAVNRAKEFDSAAEIDGAILTKADADSQGGAAISVAHVTGKPILFLGTGQGYDDIQRFDPEALVDDLLSE